jgi:hypothetical protein
MKFRLVLQRVNELKIVCAFAFRVSMAVMYHNFLFHIGFIFRYEVLTTVLMKGHVLWVIAPFTRYIVIDVSAELAASTFGLVPGGPAGSQKFWIILRMEVESSNQMSLIIHNLTRHHIF